MIARKLTAALAAGLLLVVAAPALAQLDATNRPNAQGPVATRNQLHGCRTRVEHFRGEVAARFEICYWYYLYDPDHEDNDRKNFAGFWAQGTVTPAGPWCVRQARFDLELPAARKVHARAPWAGTVLRPSSSRRYTTRLKVDAQGDGDTDAFISNTFRVFPDRMQVRRVNNGRIHRMTWAGGAGRKVAFASGVELSYRPGRELPRVDPNLFAFLARTGSC